MSWREATEFERDLLARARQDWEAWPAMLDLVRVVTLAPRIEPRLLRNARLRFTPGLSAEAEARLWFSPLVDSRDTQAILLHQGIARLLAEPMVEGRDDMPAIDIVWKFTREQTRHWSAEARLERDLRYAALIDDGPGLESGFRDILRLIHSTTAQPAAERDRERVRLSRLAKRTLPAVAQAEALPDEGRLVAQYAALALGDAAPWAVSTQTRLPDWLGQRLPAPVGAARLAVTLREDTELGRVLHFVEPASEAQVDSEALEFPTPLPARLHIAAEDQVGDWHTVGIDSRIRVPDVAVLVLTTLDGRRWAVRSPEQAPGLQEEEAGAVERMTLSFVEADRESAERIRRWLEGQGLRVDLLPEGAEAPPPGDRGTARLVRLWTAAAQREWLSRDPADRDALTHGLLLQLDDIDPTTENDVRKVQRLDWRDWQRAVDGDAGAPLLDALRQWLTMPAESQPDERPATAAGEEGPTAVRADRETEIVKLLAELDEPTTELRRREEVGDLLIALTDPDAGVAVQESVYSLVRTSQFRFQVEQQLRQLQALNAPSKLSRYSKELMQGILALEAEAAQHGLLDPKNMILIFDKAFQRDMARLMDRWNALRERLFACLDANVGHQRSLAEAKRETQEVLDELQQLVSGFLCLSFKHYMQLARVRLEPSFDACAASESMRGAEKVRDTSRLFDEEDEAAVYQTTAKVNIRTGPGIKHEIAPLGALSEGTLVSASRGEGEWRLVNVLDADGEVTELSGWVHARYLARVNASERSRPVSSSIFFSYAGDDRDRVMPIVAALEAEGWTVFWDRNIPAGISWSQYIQENLEQSQCVVVVWSQQSIHSRWVKSEADKGRDRGCLIPLKLDDVTPPVGFEDIQAADFTSWDGDTESEEWRDLVAAVERHLPRPAEPPSDVDKPADAGDVEELLAEIEDPSTPPERRLEIGDALARLGDPRQGVGLRTDGLPDIDWVEIPAGPFVFGKEKGTREQPAFFIGRYPVTNVQYQAFIDDGGYGKQARWWDGLSQRLEQPKDPRWAQPNRPRESVSWYEAMAFCRWLSNRLGYEIRLPTEAEWEKAQRDHDGRDYPWGDGYRAGFANVDEKSVGAGPAVLEQTTAVGLYPHAASPYGVEDLAGNVWEWCLNEFEDSDRTRPSGDAARALRGGSWYGAPEEASASFRYGNKPVIRSLIIGFRVMCSSPMTR